MVNFSLPFYLKGFMRYDLYVFMIECIERDRR